MSPTDIHIGALRPEEKLYEEEDALIIFSPVIDYELNESFLTEAERVHISAYENERRRNEGAAWRSALRRLTGCGETAYSRAGAPCLAGGGFHIGVSHTTGLAAVIISKNRCAIDIESRNRNFRRAAPRYLSREESASDYGYGSLWPAIVWCSKETIYKLADRPAIDLLDDIRITGSDAARDTVYARLRNAEGEWEEHTVNLFTHADVVCTWITSRFEGA